MNPTIALWYTRKKQARVRGKPPNIEVHINLWRHHPGKKDFNLLDVGVRVLDPHDLGQVIFFVPISSNRCEVQDLGSILNDEATLSAVFNEVLSIGDHDPVTGEFEVHKQRADYVTVHPFRVGADAEIEDLLDGSGVLIKFAESFCARLRQPGEHYFRFRFLMRDRGETVFSTDTTSDDGFLLSSVAISEITELRFNEARSLPNTLLERVEKDSWLSPSVRSLHYFLVRDTGFDLVAAHSNFHKMRRLEAGIWDRYLNGSMPEKAAEKMIIYHWRSGGNADSTVSDVVTLAKFRRSRANLLIYILAVIMLGALGSATHAWTLSWFTEDPSWAPFEALLLCAAGALVLSAWATKWPRRLWRTALAQLCARFGSAKFVIRARR